MLKVNIFRLLFVALLFILILPLSVKTVLADNFNLSGKITTQSGNAVSDATVTLIDPNPNTNISSTTTDASGNYNIIVSAGTYNIQVLPPTGGKLFIAHFI